MAVDAVVGVKNVGVGDPSYISEASGREIQCDSCFVERGCVYKTRFSTYIFFINFPISSISPVFFSDKSTIISERIDNSTSENVEPVKRFLPTSMEAHYVGCRTLLTAKTKGEKTVPPLPLPPLQTTQPTKGPRSLLSRFGSQAQAFFSPKKSRFGSSVAIHKLRETKWFKHDEQGILCAVLESGFIVEIKADATSPEVEEGVIAPDYHCYGIAVWKKGKEKTKNAEQIEIYTLNERSTRKRVYKTLLTSFWKKGTTIRINNVADKQEQANSEKDIRSKLDTVGRSRYDRNWHNSLHFVHWVRYGETPEQARTRQINETLKWGNVGMNMGVLLIAHNQQRRHLQTV